MRSLPVLLLLAPLLVLVPGCEQPDQADDSEPLDVEALRQRLRIRMEAERLGLDGLKAQDEAVQSAALVLQFYEERRFDPIWIGPRGPKASVDSLLSALRRADRDGLSPNGYHTETIARLHEEIGNQVMEGVGPLSDLELLCTDAFLLYGAHLLTGRVSPTELRPTWTLPARQADLLQMLETSAGVGSISQVYRSLRPTEPEYTALAGALQRYRRIAASGGWPTLTEGPTLREGDQDERVAILRQRLQTTGDFSAETPETPRQFDASLREAVRAFQERHGLEADGVVGSATRAALNVPAAERIQQLIVNLERWRWMPQDLGRRHIIVNIAGFHLRVVENGEEVLSMPVIAGRPYRETPVFSGEMSYLVLNPYWHVPHSIAVNDKLPKIKKDPDYLARQQFKVFRGWGADATPIDPSTVEWDSLSQNNFPYRLRQEPGPLNALGRVKFIFPNRHSVYLHDTPTQGLFAQAERSFSSGCIRLEQPMELADYLLAEQPEWSPERIQSVVQTSTSERSVPLHEKVPVHLQYWTAWADEDGTVHFRNDVYQRDEAVRWALAASPSGE